MLIELTLSVARMFLAYGFSLFIAYVLGYLAYSDKTLGKILLPVVDVLQSVPILTFFPVALFLIVHNIPAPFGAEVAVVFLIVTSMVWNLIFAVYESFLSMPQRYLDIIRMYKLGKLERFLKIYFPLSLKNIIPNSVVSWANGWYFLIATEIITVGSETYTLKGIGSLMLNSAVNGDYGTTLLGIGAVTMFIVFMNIFVWKPASTLVGLMFGGKEEKSIFHAILESLPMKNEVVEKMRKVLKGIVFSVSGASKRFPDKHIDLAVKVAKGTLLVGIGFAFIGVLGASFWAFGEAYEHIPKIAVAFTKSFLRITLAFAASLVWTLPVAYILWRVKILEDILLPVFEIAASIPVTAIFPILAVLIIEVFGGIEPATLLFLMTGMQWYIFFNFHGGLKSLPKFVEDLRKMYKLSELRFLEKIALPGSMGLLVIGSISAFGGGWNAVIVSEYLNIKGEVFSTEGIGQIMSSTLYGEGNLAILILASLAVGIVIPLINALVWRPLLLKYSKERWKI